MPLIRCTAKAGILNSAPGYNLHEIPSFLEHDGKGTDTITNYIFDNWLTEKETLVLKLLYLY